MKQAAQKHKLSVEYFNLKYKPKWMSILIIGLMFIGLVATAIFRDNISNYVLFLGLALNVAGLYWLIQISKYNHFVFAVKKTTGLTVAEFKNVYDYTLNNISLSQSKRLYNHYRLMIIFIFGTHLSSSYKEAAHLVNSGQPIDYELEQWVVDWFMEEESLNDFLISELMQSK